MIKFDRDYGLIPNEKAASQDELDGIIEALAAHFAEQDKGKTE